MALNPASSRGAVFDGGVITGGLTLVDAALNLDAIPGTAINITDPGTNALKLTRLGLTVLEVDKFGFVQAIGGLSVGTDDYLYITNVSAPADGTLGNGQVSLWLDATPAATKLMVKAKDSAGTVRAAAIALA